MMEIAIVSGSHRPHGESGRVARFLVDYLEQKKGGISASVIDLAKNPLPFWDDGMWSGSGPAYEAWQPVSQVLKGCDGLIVVGAEWNGTAPAALKNFFHYTSMEELAHKPGLLVGVTATPTNGAYPIAELRSSSYKNCKLCYIPDHLIIRNVSDVLGENVGGDGDVYIRDRIDYTVDVFLEYVSALKAVRASGKIETEKYGFGM